MKKFSSVKSLTKVFKAKFTKPVQTYDRKRYEGMKEQVSMLFPLLDSQPEEKKHIPLNIIDTLINSDFNEFSKALADVKRTQVISTSSSLYHQFFSKCEELVRNDEELIGNSSKEAKKNESVEIDKLLQTLKFKIRSLLDCLLIIEIFSKRRSEDEKHKLLDYLKAFSTKSADKEEG
ncbi:conserved hypothetical protein [Vibrio crassostreae]|uniref:hypothetical protein n=1 Tax=Vibrio crassostreae TaxID=246167 RepID=UPI00104301EE|nr:hypothetical protein [Vibrio crassostreae]TCT63736.1 hypothetical protein EDB40_101228 [Vibrio crassostreae]CAK2014633.1 conserved hypothetical protein [Vibrio crassostreae]CAK2076402.1 conserved hypothetical protein [Vibrio crassostreae]CAK2085355.1 conserved hypothetical protein [Vibrio crassostreae]CAK2143448.1 conserved hypothetical protein [Vibrio crassostreae]